MTHDPRLIAPESHEKIAACLERVADEHSGCFTEEDAFVIEHAIAALSSTDADQRSLFDWLAEQHCLELSFYSPVYCDDDDQAREWRVHKQGGSINDREWELVGSGDTPTAALTAARATLTKEDRS